MTMQQGKKGRHVQSKHAKAVMMHAKFAMNLAQSFEDAGLYSDMRITALCTDKELIRRIVRMVRRRFLRRTKDSLRMVPEPPGRAYETTYRQRGPFIDMIEREFSTVDHWLLNMLPGISGGYVLDHANKPPDKTPVDRMFRVYEVRQPMGSIELTRVLSRQGWQHAFLYDLVRVRDWNTSHPLCVLGSVVPHQSCPALFPEKYLCIIKRCGRTELAIQKEDRVLVWQEKKTEDIAPQ